AYMYLFNLLCNQRVGVIEEHEGGEPSAQHITNIITNMTAYNCKLIVTDPQHSDDHVISIAREISGCKISYLTPLLYPDYGIDSYIEMIDYDLWALEFPIDPPITSNWVLWVIIGGSIGIVGIVIALLYWRYRTIE
ncbi:MAG: metal ABC transporter solute-binding protein, Zn/Mn family, partial [Candidatus Helarchaeota archaeon]